MQTEQSGSNRIPIEHFLATASPPGGGGGDDGHNRPDTDPAQRFAEPRSFA